ncbi:hypothetical protein MCAP1_001817 [Malassezia caprae]|uniref:Uncharacterized protein n=1 Tax=Malassezia caprae TaxID=1381934 RepID=A0AAF0IWH8_9BASI|nr:hypothetical protein MCAP1_001817 [Malassezia caprae]
MASAFGQASQSPQSVELFKRTQESDLPKDVLAAFEAERFTWGEIPQVEPPAAFCGAPMLCQGLV